uniref:DUF5904 domain-containing protein n=1 Tax=viral metagenome TaxID=1070528 RepID=A0A6C0KHC0_9ZZZZ
MNGYVAGIAFLMLVSAIMSMATASIGIQCYNKCDSPNMNQTMPNNKTYLVISLVLSIILLFASFGCFYAAWKIPSFGGMGGMGKLGGMGGMGGGGNLLNSLRDAAMSM